MKIENLIRSCFDENCVLFVGAGYSANAVNLNGSNIPVASAFSRQLSNAISLREESENLGYTSELYQEKNGLSKLSNLIRNSFSVQECAELHQEMARFDWRRIYTTNYDNVIEIANIRVGNKKIISATTSDNAQDVLKKFGSIIHLNGYVERLNTNNFDDEFRLTDTSYLINQFTDSPWSRLFESDVKNCDAVIFIGYSLRYDYELKKVLYNSTVRDKTFFIVDPSFTSEEEKYTMSKFGEVIEYSYDEIANVIREERSNYKKIEFIHKSKSLFEINPVPGNLSEESAKDVINLFINGKIVDDHIKNGLKGYYVQSYPCDCEKHNASYDDWIISLLDDYKVLNVKSDLGNGKTVFLKVLGYKLSQKYKVYTVENEDSIEKELDTVYHNSPQDKIIIIIDDYNMRFKTLECCKLYMDKFILIISCRTHLNSNVKPDLLRLTRVENEDVISIDINNLSHKERLSLIYIYDKYHLWGEKDLTTQSEKEKYLQTDCKNSYSNILLDLLVSKNIQKKIDEIYIDVTKNNQIHDFMIASSVNKLCNLKIDYSTICRLLSVNSFEIESQIRKSNSLQIFSYENYEYEVKSSVFAKYLCHKNENTSRIVDILVRMVKNAVTIEINKEFFNFKKFIVSTSNLNLVLGANKEESITKFFEGILNVGDFNRNPYFWFQFAINLTNTGDYELAETYFSNAYKYAGKLESYDKYQLDTHYARFLFEKALNFIVPENPMDVFMEAHSKLVPQKRNNYSNRGEKLYFSLKQVYFYKDFYNRYKSKFTPIEQMKYIKNTQDLLELFDEYFKELSLNSNKLPYKVRKSLDSLGNIDAIDTKLVTSKYPQFFSRKY